MFLNLLLDFIPIPKIRRSNPPQIILKLSLTRRRPFERFIRTVTSSKFSRRFDSSMINRFKDLNVEMFSLGGIKRHSHCQKRIRQPLNTNSDRSMTHIGSTSFFDGIIIDIDNLVEIVCNDFDDIVHFLEIEFSAFDKSGKSDTRQVTYGNFIGSRVFDDFGTEIGTFDGSEVLLVGFT